MAGNSCSKRFYEHAGCLLGCCELSCREGDKIAVLKVQCLHDLLFDRGGKLGDASDQLAVFIDTEPIRLAACLYLYVCQHLVDHLSGAGKSGYDDRLNAHVCRNRLAALFLCGSCRKRTEAAVCENFRHILDGQIDTQIRFIRSVFFHCLKIRDPHERSAARPVVRAVFGKYRRKNVLDDGKYIFLGSKRHFHIQLIELARASVAARIFIAEAWSDLEIAVKSGGHEQLLELLRCLRKRIELAGMLSGRNKVIAGALR